jgi:hypothetical protein
MKPVLALALSLLAAHATAAAEIDAYVELCLPEVGSLMQHA